MSARHSLGRLRAAIDEAMRLEESDWSTQRASVWANANSAMDAIERAAAGGGAANAAELRALLDGFRARWVEVRSDSRKKRLHDMHELLRGGLERVLFQELSSGAASPCGCSVWRKVSSRVEGGLATQPSFKSARVVEEVDEADESYRVHACGVCGERWIEDANPDSDPSVTRWCPW